MREQWTLPEGIEKLFPAKADSEIDDLSTDERHLILDVSFAEGSDDGVEGLSIILTGSYEPIEEDGEPNLMFSAFVPANTKELPELVKRIATSLSEFSSFFSWVSRLKLPFHRFARQMRSMYVL